MNGKQAILEVVGTNHQAVAGGRGNGAVEA